MKVRPTKIVKRVSKSFKNCNFRQKTQVFRLKSLVRSKLTVLEG